MRKFRKALDELIAANPNGNDFLCAPEFKKYATTLNYQYKGFGIVINESVPKDGIYFVKYGIDE
jgi:hypothetical protein